MDAILNFLKSLVSPIRMVRYRYMTVFIAILIFVLSSSILSIPTNNTFNREKYNWIDEDNVLGLQALTQMPTEDSPEKSNVNAVLAEIKAKKYEVVKNGYTYDLITPNEEKLENGEMVYNQEYEMYYINNEGRKVNITIIVDLFDKIEDDKLSDDDKVKFNVKKFDEDAYKATETDDHHMIVLYTDAIFYRVNAKVKDAETGDFIDVSQFQKSFWSDKYSFSTDNFGQTADETGLYLARLIVDGYVMAYSSINQFFTLIYCIVYPLIITLLFWLLFRKTGRLKTFKEYYNIASISSIVPIVLMFIILWFIPNFNQYYIFVFATFYLYQLMKINSLPELV